MNQGKQFLAIENIKRSIMLLEDNTGTKLKETILNDLTLLEPHLKEAPKSVYLIALEESLKLQAHYGQLLNDSDGGKRRIFKSVHEWLQRLKETGTFNDIAERRARGLLPEE